MIYEVNITIDVLDPETGEYQDNYDVTTIDKFNHIDLAQALQDKIVEFGKGVEL